MANKASKTQIRTPGGEVTHHQAETDTPILPVEALEKLHGYRPDLVDFVKDETKIQADHRRKEERRVHSFIFIENIAAQIFTFLIAIASIGFATVALIKGQPWVGGLIMSATAVALAFAIRAISKSD